MTKAQNRFFEGREKRLKCELAYQQHNTPVVFQCVYKREEQKNQFKRGWNSVNEIDISVFLSQHKRETAL